MELKEINIKKYKSIENQTINNFPKFNILVGPNNAGKTNILDSLEVFFNDHPSLRRKNSRIALTINTSNGIKKLTYINGEVNYKFSEKEYKSIKKSIRRINSNNPLQKIATEKLEHFKTNFPQQYKQFSKVLENNFQNIQISEDLFKANVKTNEGKESIQRMGAGFKRLFVILFYLYHPDYKILLIDEPELHLHPSIIKKFLKILDSNNLDTQVLMTTHHPTFVQAKYLSNIWRVARNKEKSTAIYKFNKTYKLKSDRFIQEINDDNSAMLFSDKVLLVEGVSDRILMRGLIDKFYNKNKSIKVVFVGGIGDISLYEKICQIFNIPYSVMVDGDGLDFIFDQKFNKYKKSDKKKRELLKEKGIFVLKKALEENYPKKYQIKDSKPLNALVASKNITKEDYNSPKMKKIKEIIESL